MSGIMSEAYRHQNYGRTRAEWIANLNTEYTPPKMFRRTSIICTIGMFDKSTWTYIKRWDDN